ncbi:type I inositol polyphosphate 5-phosphatase 2 isoform X1 [Cryptomeria japonica]|uniref:type I inositol polyphosphate 5-phosphatase 2 isoform X1 n=1 Tax=Cryptomeria japonica TaxID=3369 RepID=UPI0027D9F4A2|nr:type I inositol polyphosphate 5-phosphatase 2 isoform X1 [Cryptomeria japonica]
MLVVHMMWPRLVANKLLGKSGCETYNTDGRDTESETEDEDNVAPLPSKTPQRPSLLSSTNSCSIPQSPQNSGKPPKSPSPSPSPSSSPCSTPTPSNKLMRMKSETLWTDYVKTEEYRVFVGTWNVAGITPPDDLDLEDWLNPTMPSDIYVIGFQEIVPLKAGNVFGSEGQAGPAKKWDALIRGTLNKTSKPQTPRSTIARSSSAPSSTFLDALNSHFFKSPISKDDIALSSNSISRSGSDSIEEELERFYEGEADDEFPSRGHHRNRPRQRFKRIASKQMVGLFISIWVRRELVRHISDPKVDCVGCGLMGCLGNKGSISVSFSLHETSFCFVCAHLASGQKEGDELHRNSHVVEILKRTIFGRPSAAKPILAHNRIIWFGDLNYRIALNDSEIRSLVEKEEWKTLLQSDQLKMELSTGHVFEGWHEGPIQFSPTYKYIPNSDQYHGTEHKAGEKRRSPAWCDRILWFGKGLKQVSYEKQDFRLSDHRPVKAIYLAEVEVLSNHKMKKTLGLSTKVPEMSNILTVNRHMFHGLNKINSDAIASVEQNLLPILN